ncbi:MAG: twin-arginine translocase TatA/TatE family subunit [Acidimicrobiaceae bacterium]|nr:twin-arginine translocase TatA/TatE family subunit [Acidimicrobiaceae bacterium]
MGNLDPAKIAIVLVVALVVLGPEKLPGFTKQAGAWWGEFQRVRARLQAEINGAVNQINTATSPLADSFKAASSGVSGIFPSLFSNEYNKPPESANATSTVESENNDTVPRSDPRVEKWQGWGVGEAESGYGYGDPRLN